MITNYTQIRLKPFRAYKVKVRSIDMTGKQSSYSQHFAFYTRAEIVETKRWGDTIADANGVVDTQTSLGWLSLSESD